MLRRSGARPVPTAIGNRALECVSLARAMTRSSRTKHRKQEIREEHDDYIRLVCKLNDRWRLVICRDLLQFVVQRKRGERCGRARWEGAAFFQTREGVKRFCRNLEPILPSARRVIAQLPNHIKIEG